MDENRADIHEIVVKYLYRPFIMLAREPILVLVTLYMSLNYGISKSIPRQYLSGVVADLFQYTYSSRHIQFRSKRAGAGKCFHS